MHELIENQLLWSLFLQACLQLAVLGVLAWLAHQLLRRRPRLQYFVWLLALVATVLAIPTKFLIPAWNVQLPAKEVVMANTPSMPELDVSALGAPAFDTGPVAEPELEFATVPSVELPASEVATSGEQFRRTSFSFLNFAAFLYVAVAMLLLVRLSGAILGLRCIRHRGKPMSNTAKLPNSVFAELKLSRKPKVLLSNEIEVPMAFGVVKPTILLPDDFESWGSGMQRVVLLHEGTHIKRRDAIWDLVSQVTAAVYWFHPAVHVMSLFLRRTREKATDSLVLDHDVSATEYAKRLLEIVPTRRRPLEPALFMACHGDLGDRIKSILDARVPTKLSRMQSAIFRLGVVLVLVPVACMTVRFSTAIASDSLQATEQSSDVEVQKLEDSNVNVAGATFYDRIQQIDPRELLSLTSNEITVVGRVEDENGVPIEDATVVLRDCATMFIVGESGGINDVVAKTTSGKNGLFRFSDIPNNNRPSGGGNQFEIFVVTPERAGLAKLPRLNATTTGEVEIDEAVKALPVTEVSGRVVSPAGVPLKDVEVRFHYFSRPDSKGFVQQSFFGDRIMNPSTVTDSEGRFSIDGVPSGVAAGFMFIHPDYATNFETIRLNGHPEQIRPRNRAPRILSENDSTIALDHGVLISGVVLDQASKAKANVEVSILTRSWRSDANGRFEMRVPKARLSDDHLELWITDLKSLKRLKYTRRHIAKVSELKDGTAQLIFTTPAKLRGRVVTEAARTPVPGVFVNIESVDGTDAAAITDKDGFFEREIDPGRTYVRPVVKGGKLGMSFPKGGDDHLDLEPGETSEVEILLTPNLQSKAQVVGPDGKPIENADVGFCHDGAFQSIVKSGPDGEVGLDSFSTDENSWSDRLFARYIKDGKTFWAEADIRNQSKRHKLQLATSQTVAGTILVAGKPLQGVTVEVLKNDNPKALRITKVTTDSAGKYSVEVPSVNYDGSAARYRISLEESKLIPNQNVDLIVQHAMTKGDQKVANIDLIQGAGKISGVVVDSKGEPVTDSLVEVQHLMMRNPERKEIQPSQLFESTSQRTDGEGRFEFTGLPEGFETIIVAGVDSARRGASVVAVGNQTVKVLVTDVGEESKVRIPLR